MLVPRKTFSSICEVGLREIEKNKSLLLVGFEPCKNSSASRHTKASLLHTIIFKAFQLEDSKARFTLNYTGFRSVYIYWFVRMMWFTERDFLRCIRAFTKLVWNQSDTALVSFPYTGISVQFQLVAIHSVHRNWRWEWGNN